MKQYLELGRRILDDGKMIKIGDTSRLTVFGAQMSFDLTAGFPILTTKRIPFRWVVEELLWFLNGSTNVRDLQKVGVTIWDANAKEDGTIGDAYGAQWRNWNGEGYDQIANCINMLRKRPRSTRNVVVAWNPAKVDGMALPPCHFSFQCLSDGENLTLCATMRSTDFCLGLPFNIASYALLTHILAEASDLNPAGLIMQLSHVHVYDQHIAALREQLSRIPHDLPELRIDPPMTPDLKHMSSDWFTLREYDCHDPIRYEMVVT